ncbi:hypothetical protein D3C87_1186450 [compost metagenome]
MTVLTVTQRKALEDIEAGKVGWCQESPTSDVRDYQMLYEAGLIDGANASADDGFGLIDMRLTMAGQQALSSAPEAVRMSRDGVEAAVVPPLWKRWGFWYSVVGSLGVFITFVLGVLTYWKTFGW